MKLSLLLISMCLSCMMLHSQSSLTEHTLALDSPEHTAQATIADCGWLAGRWEGKGFGGIVEETWNPAVGGTMIGTFRLVTEGKPDFYEFLLLTPENNSLVYKVKHFSPDLKGWEEKDDYHTFPLIKVAPNALYFHGFTILRHGNKCTHYLAMGQKDGTHQEASLEYILRDVPESAAALEFSASIPEITKVPLLMLGSYHMSNPGMDMFNLKSDDVLAPKRQEEIQTVVDQLALWGPTKVVVEAPFGDSATIARYEAYLHDERSLSSNEREQIGFRLAKQLGHKTIYPVDVQFNLNDDALGAVISTNPQKYGAHMQELEVIGKAAMAQMNKWLGEGTIGAMLYKMNDPDLTRLSHALYFRIFLPIINGSNYAGADLVSDWYHRNLRIFSNLHQISDSPDDRIFIVYGQGHIPLLQQFAEDSPYFRVEYVQEYLRGL